MSRHETYGTVMRDVAVSERSRRLGGTAEVLIAEPERPSEPDLEQLRLLFANELLQLADAERQQARSEARAELEAAMRKMRDEQAQWRQRLETEHRDALAREHAAVGQLVDTLRERQQALLPDMQAVVARLVLTAVASVLGESASRRVLIDEIAASAVAQYQLEAPLTIWVSSDDHARLTHDEIASTWLTLMRPDKRLSAGDCQIDYGAGRLDVSLDTQWQALRRLLTACSE